MQKLALFTALALFAVAVLILWVGGAEAEAPIVSGRLQTKAPTQAESEELMPLAPDSPSQRVSSDELAVGEAESSGKAEVSGSVPAAVESRVPTGECGLRVILVGMDTTGALVSIQAGQSPFMGGDFLPERSQTKPLRSTSGVSGEVEFMGLKAMSWSVGVLLASGRHWRTFTALSGDEAMTEVKLEWGNSSVEGTAWNDDGSPRSGLGIQLEISSEDETTGAEILWRSWARTDELGRYRLDGFRPGHGWMLVAPSGDLEIGMNDPGSLMSESIGLTRDEHRIIDFGSPVGMVDVLLTFFDASGRAMRDGQVTLTPSGPASPGAAEGPDVVDQIDQDGNVLMRCAPGSYLVLLRTWGRNHGSLGEIDTFGPGRFERSFAIKSGHAVHGTVVDAAGKARTGMTQVISLAMRREPSPKSRIVQSTRIRPDGTFSFYSVQPGDYHLTTGTGETFRSSAVSLPDSSPIAVDLIVESSQ